MDYTNVELKQEINEHGMIYELGSIYDYFGRIEDTRSNHGKQYPLTLLLTRMLLAKLNGEDKPSGIAEWKAHRKEKWVEYQLTDKEKTPSHMTYRCVLQDIVSMEEFEEMIEGYHRQRLEVDEGLVMSIDGKTVRGTIRVGELQGTHLLAVYVPKQGLVLAQIGVDRKENEISVAPQLLKQVDLAGAIVIADAMHTQKAFCKPVVEAGGDYVLTVKENQPRTHWAIEKLFVHEVCNLQKGAPLSADFKIASQVEKKHGRIEKRTIMTSTLLNDDLDWPSLAQVFRIEKVTWHEHSSRYTRHIRYGITSLSAQEATPEKFLELTKAYWGIESGLHYRRDVTMKEDATRLTVGHSGQNMAILNNLVIGLCLSGATNNLASVRRFFAAYPMLALKSIISACQSIL